MYSKRGWAHVLFVLSSALLSVAQSLTLQPSVDKIHRFDVAVFTCSFNCSIQTEQTHTIYWLAGDALNINDRAFSRGNEHEFTARSGLYVEIVDISTCTNGTPEDSAMEQLRINGSSAELYNRTAVQCVAIPRHKNIVSIYSAYSLMLIDSPDDLSPMPSKTFSSMSTVSSFSSEKGQVLLPSPTPTLVTVTQVVTTTETIILSPTNTVSSTNAVGILQEHIAELCNSNQIAALCSSEMSIHSFMGTWWYLLTLLSQILLWTLLHVSY